MAMGLPAGAVRGLVQARIVPGARWAQPPKQNLVASHHELRHALDLWDYLRNRRVGHCLNRTALLAANVRMRFGGGLKPGVSRTELDPPQRSARKEGLDRAIDGGEVGVGPLSR